MLDSQSHLTTVQVAAILKCSQRGVRNLIKRGRLKGILVPIWRGAPRHPSFDGRYIIRRRDLLSYMRQRGHPLSLLDELHTNHVLLVGCGPLWAMHFSAAFDYNDGWKVHLATDPLNAGIIAGRSTPMAVILDQGVMDEDSGSSVRSLRKIGCQQIIALLNEDCLDPQGVQRLGFDQVVRKPADPKAMAAAIKDATLKADVAGPARKRGPDRVPRKKGSGIPKKAVG